MATFSANWIINGGGKAGYPKTSSGQSVQPITETSATQKHPLLTRCVAEDRVLGEVEFIYAKGVASTAAGDVVQINGVGTTTRAAGGTAVGMVGVAMSANVANQYGWYAIKGRVYPVTIAADITTPQMFLAAAGVADDTVAATKLISGAILEACVDAGGSAIVGTDDTTAAHAAVAVINYPYAIVAV